MQPLSVKEIREKYLKFFESKDHLRLPSFSLVPQGDKSLLLINAGMTPLKPYFTGQEIPPRARVATCQKCVRTIDIDEVGHDGRHLSFFQMLGNFSFADYFKTETITWAWEFMTEVVKFPKDKLYVTVYLEDDEAFDIWHKNIGLEKDRIFKFGKEEGNFWEHGIGPCGPCSEIFFDRGEKYACSSDNCTVGCDCDRFMEVWNLVFIQFDKISEGNYQKLANHGIDTGMGLERMALIMQGVDSVYDIDTFAKYQKVVRELTKTPCGTGDVSVRIITDHIHSIIYMAADGILPSNEGRGYVLRRLLRRAVRHAKLLGRDTPFITELCPVIIEENKDAYPELAEKQAHIITVLSNEENRFLTTLDTGVALLTELCQNLRKDGSTDVGKDGNKDGNKDPKKIFPGSEVFRLYDTYGFPPELTKEMLEEEGFTYDEEGFKTEMENQRSRARAARGESNYMGADETVFHQLDASLSTEFVGYTSQSCQAKILAITQGPELCKSINAKEQAGGPMPSGGPMPADSQSPEVAIFLDKTPFYVEAGGQKGDTGTLTIPEGDGSVNLIKIKIHDCIKVAGGKTAHIGHIIKGSVSVGDTVCAAIDSSTRLDTARNHTATHLLNGALRKVLGDHIEQAGSEVTSQRLRFDFTHFSSVSPEDLKAIEEEVNANIFAGYDVDIKEMPLEEARKAGAIMLMGEKGEKYGEFVRVVNIGQTSVELCGGTHVDNTVKIGVFKITSEGSVAAGIRRIEGVSGSAALTKYREAESQLEEVAAILKAPPDQLVNRLLALNAELKQAKQEIEKTKSKMAQGQVSDILKNQEEYANLTWLYQLIPGLDAASLRTMGDQLKEKVDVLLLSGTTEGGPVQFLAHASKRAVEAGVNAGNMVKEAASICGGGGGGKPGNAQAGGKDASKAQEALMAGITLAKKSIG